MLASTVVPDFKAPGLKQILGAIPEVLLIDPRHFMLLEWTSRVEPPPREEQVGEWRECGAWESTTAGWKPRLYSSCGPGHLVVLRFYFLLCEIRTVQVHCWFNYGKSARQLDTHLTFFSTELSKV